CRRSTRWGEEPRALAEATVNVLYLIDSLASGGAESSLVELAPHLRRAGVDIEVAYLNDRSDLRPRLDQLGVLTFCLAGGGGRAGWLRRATRLVRDRRPHLIHTTLFEADLIGR